MNRTYPPQPDFVLLIPCYDNLPGLIASLQSILYPFDKFFVLIVDDGSRQPVTMNDLASFTGAGLNIHIIRLPYNQGITAALNYGLQWINANTDARYIARLDCGDTCSAERFEKQVTLLDQCPDIEIVGSWCHFKNYATGQTYLYKTPTEYRRIQFGMNFRNLFIHPTVMWRRSSLIYPENFPHAEDYGFFYTILEKGKGAIIPEPLVTCEINPKGISLAHRKQQLKSRMKVIRHYSRNKLLKGMGVFKLLLLLALPYSFVQNTKLLLYGK